MGETRTHSSQELRSGNSLSILLCVASLMTSDDPFVRSGSVVANCLIACSSFLAYLEQSYRNLVVLIAVLEVIIHTAF